MNANDITWKFSDGLTDYDDAIQFMEKRVAQIREGSEKELSSEKMSRLESVEREIVSETSALSV